MPDKCSVPNCRGNYRNEECVSVFRFPRKEPLRSLWLKSIGREDFNPTIHAKICERHFKPSDVIRETSIFDNKTKTWVNVPSRVAIRKGAIPLPENMLIGSNQGIKRKKRKSEDNPEVPAESNLENLPPVIHDIADVTDEIQLIERIDFNDLSELEINCYRLDLYDFWTTTIGNNSLAFIHIKWMQAPKIHVSVVVDENLSVSIFHGDVEIKATKTFAFPRTVRNIVELNFILNEAKEENIIQLEGTRKLQLVEELLDSLKENFKSHQVTLNFLKEQTSLLTEKQRIYSQDLLTFATLLFSMAPHAYQFLMHCENIILPELDIIKNLYIPMQSFPDKDFSPIKFLKHAKESFSSLTDSDKHVVLQIAEVHLKPFEVEGNIAGMSIEKDDAATSVFVFMINSLRSNYKDTVHLLPVKTLIIKEIHNAVKDVITGLEYIGFRISAVVTDDSFESKHIMSLFAEPPLLNSIVYKHPYDSPRPLFHLINYTDLLKNIRNDWMRRSDHGQSIFYPSIHEEHSIQTASFYTLKRLHDVESKSCLKHFASFSSKAVSPENTERHNIELVLEIFKDSVSDRLILFGEDQNLPHYQDTADFLKLICTWWSTVHPNSACKRVSFEGQPILSSSTALKNYIFLQRFLDWLDIWSHVPCDSGVTFKTHSELHLSTYALIELTAYCNDELGMSFIYPGNIQMDYQVQRFGIYREPPNLEYFQKKQQWPRIEPKLKSMDSLLLTLRDVNDVDLTELNQKPPVNLTEASDKLITYIPIMITSEDIALNKTNFPILFYLAAHCTRSALMKFSCKYCKCYLSTEVDMVLNPFISDNDINEETLKYPSRVAMNIVVLTFTVLAKLCKEHAREFWTRANRNPLAYNLTINILESTALGLDYQLCCKGHSLSQAVKMLVKSVVYTVLDNYVEDLLEL